MSRNTDNIATIISGLLLFVFAVLLWSICLGLPTMLLWNWLMPIMFGFKQITFWQAFGFTLLCRLLFTSSTTNNINTNNKKKKKD